MNSANASVTAVPPRIEPVLAWRLLPKVLVLFAVIGALAVLYWFNPAQHGFYPRCALYQTTGWLCPGCGSLRAMHQLLHGHVADAFRLNALLVLSLPFFAWLAGLWAVRKFQHRPFRLMVRPFYMWAGFAVLLLFGIGRNLR